MAGVVSIIHGQGTSNEMCPRQPKKITQGKVILTAAKGILWAIHSRQSMAFAVDIMNGRGPSNKNASSVTAKEV